MAYHIFTKYGESYKLAHVTDNLVDAQDTIVEMMWGGIPPKCIEVFENVHFNAKCIATIIKED